MKKLCTLLLLPVFAFGGETVADRLDWMLGCWSTPDGAAIEVWTVEDEHTLVGFSATVRENRIVFYEVLTISAGEDDALVYTARPSNQPEASFEASGVDEQSIVFRNPVHDYPQQIAYERNGERLGATIALIGGANPTSFDKIACGAR